MIHHVALETRVEDAQACVAFYALLGFARVEPPETLRDRAVWLALGAQQVHLLLTEEPDVPPRGHVAVVLGDYEAAIARLVVAGYDLEPRQQHWGSPRGYVRDPAGHVIEIMKFPPG